MVSGKTEMVGRKQLTFFKMINALVQRARPTVKTQNHFPSPNWPAQLPDLSIIENLWLAIKKLQARKKKFIGRIISRKTENLDHHVAAVCAKFIHLHSKNSGL